MLILFDNGVPAPLRYALKGHVVVEAGSRRPALQVCDSLPGTTPKAADLNFRSALPCLSRSNHRCTLHLFMRRHPGREAQVRERFNIPTDAEKEALKWKSQRGECGFGSIIGQEEAVTRLRAFANAFQRKPSVVPDSSAHGREVGQRSKEGLRSTPGHILFVGPGGMGKRTMARAFAAEYCNGLTERYGSTLTRTGDLMGVLTNLAEGDALLIAGIDRLTKASEDFLLPAMTEGKVDFVAGKGMFAKTINVPLKPFVLLATAPSPAACSRQLLECFLVTITLVQQYSDAELALICQRIAQRKGMLVSPDAATLIASMSRRTPHDLELIISKLASVGKTAIALGDVTEIMSVLGLSAGAASGGSSFAEMAGLSGVEFEHAITGLLERMGFCAQMTKASGDGGVDIAATLERPFIGGKYLFQCKCFSPDHPVEAATVREFYGAVTADQEAVKGILVTTSVFTAQAREFARHLRIELVDGEQLAQLWAAQKQWNS